MTGKTTFRDRALRAIAILGLVAILLLGAWGIIQIAFTLYGFLGSTPSPAPVTQTTPKPEQMSVTVPSVINSGTPFTLSFAHQNATGNYSYAISYSCAEGLTLQAPLPTGKMQTVACNTPFNYTNATATMQLTATVAGSKQVTTTFTVASVDLASKATTSTGTATANVLPPAAVSKPAPTTTAPPKTSTPGSTYIPAKHTSSLYGLSDLAVSTGSVVNNGGRYSVTFTIQNVGTNITPANWTFSANLPTSPTYVYTSNPQQALYPGDKIVYTLGFTMQSPTYNYNNSYSYNYGYGQATQTNCLTYGYLSTSPYTYGCTSYATSYTNTNTNPYGYTGYPTYSNSYTSNVMTITADPSGYVAESNKGNNTTSITLQGY